MSQEEKREMFEAKTETPNTGGVTMGEETKQSEDVRQDQHGADQDGKPGSDDNTTLREKYNGTKPHSVSPKNIITLKQAYGAKARLKLRLKFLNEEYDKNTLIIKDSQKENKERVSAFEINGKINTELKTFSSLISDLNDKTDELEKSVMSKVESFDPSTKVEVTI